LISKWTTYQSYIFQFIEELIKFDYTQITMLQVIIN